MLKVPPVSTNASWPFFQNVAEITIFTHFKFRRTFLQKASKSTKLFRLNARPISQVQTLLARSFGTPNTSHIVNYKHFLTRFMDLVRQCLYFAVIKKQPNKKNFNTGISSRFTRFMLFCRSSQKEHFVKHFL